MASDRLRRQRCAGGTGPGGPDATVSGTVLDQRGLPVEGVVVSDGLLTTLTDESGNYALDSDLSKRRFVQVTIPAAYEIPVKDGIPQFWQRIPEGSTKVRADFTLTARRKAGPAVYDPDDGRSADSFAQCALRPISHSIRSTCTRRCATICRRRPRRLPTVRFTGISLGDLVHNDMSLYPTYCAGIADFDFPVFNVIGNHDHVQNVGDRPRGGEEVRGAPRPDLLFGRTGRAAFHLPRQYHHEEQHARSERHGGV